MSVRTGTNYGSSPFVVHTAGSPLAVPFVSDAVSAIQMTRGCPSFFHVLRDTRPGRVPRLGTAPAALEVALECITNKAVQPLAALRTTTRRTTAVTAVLHKKDKRRCCG